jgi:hypothetical protein
LALLAHPLGPLKGIPAGSRKIALLSQADTAEDVRQARAVATAMASFGFERAVIGSFASEDPLKEVISSRRAPN